MDRLPDNWRIIITQRLAGNSLAEAGRRLGVSRQRALQIYRQACRKARLAMARSLLDLLDTAGEQNGQAR